MFDGVHAYLAAIGLPAQDAEHARERARDYMSRARVFAVGDSKDRVVALDNSGACLAIRGDTVDLRSVVPYFAGARRNRAIVLAVIEDANGYDRLVMHVTGRDHQPRFEAEVLAHDLPMRRDMATAGARTSVALTALASEFHSVAPGDATHFPELGEGASAWRSSPTEPARALVRGRILRASTPLNRASRVHFQHARIEVHGLNVDVVAPEPDPDRDHPELEAGASFEGRVLVIGTLDPARHDGTIRTRAVR